MNPKVAIIVLNWNGQDLLNDCLSAVLDQTYTNFTVYFVDNGSEDGSVSLVEEKFPQVEVVKKDHNTGFAKGMNDGIREALIDNDVEYLICLNNDTIVSKTWLHELIKTAQGNPRIGGVSSKAYFEDGKRIQNAGLDFSKSLQVNRLGGLSMGYGFTDEDVPHLSEDIEIFSPGGVAPLYKREVIEKLLKRDGEVFDEGFFAYAEDYDLGFRIRGLGYTSKLSAKAHLIHLHSKTVGVASPFKVYYSERNMILTAVKNLSRWDLFLFPFRSFRTKISYFYRKNESVARLKEEVGIFQVAKILVKAYLSAISMVPKYLKKRKNINSV